MPDILISFDTTGSMYPCIHEVRQKIEDFVKDIYAKVDDVRIMVLAHGDYCDRRCPYDIARTEFLRADNANVLIEFIRTVQQTSGGDHAEMYEEVFHQAKSFSWRPDREKIMIMIADSVPHEKHNQTNLDWRVCLNELKEKGIRLFGIQCLDHYGSRPFYNHIATTFETPALRLAQFRDIVPALTTLIYHTQSQEMAKDYVNSISLNRGLSDFMRTLFGEKMVESAAVQNLLDSELPLDVVPPGRFQLLTVDEESDIMSFVERSGAHFQPGRGFYELTKSELVQEYKEVVLVHKRTGDMYTGKRAREIVGLPYGKRGKLNSYSRPPGYDVFVQSTSYNRKLVPGTRFLYEVG